MPNIQVNGLSMYYESHGNGDPLILIAGFTADHLTWLPVIDSLAKSYRIIIFDNRGAGQTDVPAEPYTIAEMAADVASLCQLLKIQQAHFVGSSMGGFILQMLAKHYPNLIKTAVFVNSSMNTHCGFHVYADAQKELRLAKAPPASLYKAACAWVFSYRFLSSPGMLDALIRLGLNNPYPLTDQGYAGQYAALETFDSTEWISNIKVPSLVMGGDQDLIFPEMLVKKLANSIPGAEYHSFKECGHLPFIEFPEQFVSILKSFHTHPNYFSQFKSLPHPH